MKKPSKKKKTEIERKWSRFSNMLIFVYKKTDERYIE